MATIPTGYAQVVMPLTHAGLARSAAVVYGVKVDSSPASAQALADSQETIFGNNLAGLIDDQVTIGPAHVSWELGGGPISADGTLSEPGSLSDSTASPQVAVLISKSSLTPGRKGRGRMYLPWAATDASLDELGNLDPAAVAVMQGAFDDWVADLVAADERLYILHTGAGTPAAVTGMTVQGKVATQRRRLRP